MGDTGLEALAESSRNSPISEPRAAKCAAHAAIPPSATPNDDVQRLAASLAALPAQTRAALAGLLSALGGAADDAKDQRDVIEGGDGDA